MSTVAQLCSLRWQETQKPHHFQEPETPGVVLAPSSGHWGACSQALLGSPIPALPQEPLGAQGAVSHTEGACDTLTMGLDKSMSPGGEGPSGPSSCAGVEGEGSVLSLTGAVWAPKGQ